MGGRYQVEIIHVKIEQHKGDDKRNYAISDRLIRGESRPCRQSER